MPVDLSVDMIKATVQLEQSLGDGQRTVGTGFLIDAPTADGRPRTILVTAAHVLQKMPSQQASIGYRFQTQTGWRYDPQPLTIRIPGGQEKWTRHPTRDVAALEITAPPEFARSAIPLSWLAGDETFHQRLELLVQTMLLDDTVRLPGTRRQQAAAAARAEGIEVAPGMLAQLQSLAAG